jgi:hypothetical protein
MNLEIEPKLFETIIICQIAWLIAPPCVAIVICAWAFYRLFKYVFTEK